MAAAQASVDPDAPGVEQVAEQAIARAGVFAPAGSLSEQFEQVIDSAVEDAVRHPVAWFAFVTETITQAGVTDQGIATVLTIDEAGVQAAVRAGMQAASQAAAAAGAQAYTAGVQAGMQALRLAIEQAVVQAVMQPDVLDGEPSADTIKDKVTEAISGDGIRKAAETVIQYAADAPGSNVPPTVVPAGVQEITRALEHAVPQIGTSADNATMAYAGSADIGVMPGTVLQVTECAGMWTIQASDVVAQPASQPVPPLPGVQLAQVVPAAPPATSDAPLAQPVLIDAPGGVKVTVTGAADIRLRKGSVISAPRRGYYELPRNRQLLAPQGTNILVANLGIILIVNTFTMFGIGAELGIAGVLAGFSNATGHGRGFIFLALAAVAVLVVVYAVTATRAMADPEPGSSVSSQAGASFTL